MTVRYTVSRYDFGISSVALTKFSALQNFVVKAYRYLTTFKLKALMEPFKSFNGNTAIPFTTILNRRIDLGCFGS